MSTRSILFLIPIVTLLFGVIDLQIYIPVLTKDEIRITSPSSGQVLKEVVQISGSNFSSGFLSSEISFSYSEESDPKTWFEIVTIDQSITDGILAEWDTTQITDGNYDLRLRVFFLDGSLQDMVIPDLHIRNYSIMNNVIPVSPTFITETVAITPILTITPMSISTSLPENPLVINPTEIKQNMIAGSMLVLGLILIIVISKGRSHH
jgi:hypothetical protein